MGKTFHLKLNHKNDPSMSDIDQVVNMAECLPQVLLIRQFIGSLMEIRLGEAYNNALASFQKMENGEFLKLATSQIKNSNEQDWQSHPQYYLALMDHFGSTDLVSAKSSIQQKEKEPTKIIQFKPKF